MHQTLKISIVFIKYHNTLCLCVQFVFVNSTLDNFQAIIFQINERKLDTNFILVFFFQMKQKTKL